MARLAIIGYDGSHDADLAVDFAASRLQPERARVVTVWEPGIAGAEVPAPLGVPPVPALGDEAELERAARDTAEEGAARARRGGVEADAATERGIGVADIARLLVDIAEREDADLLVVGRRGLGPIRSAVLGSVSDAAIRDGRRPVLVVPGPSEHD